MGKPNFSDEFKRDAAAQITERGYPVAEVSERLGVSQHSLYAWKRQLARQVSGDAGKDAEIRQLKRELARVTEERDILKKPPRISPGMQSEIRVHCRASRSFRRAGNVPVLGCAAEWLLCLAEEPAEPAGSGRCPADRSDPQSLERQRPRKPLGSMAIASCTTTVLDHGETCCPNRVARLTRLAGIKAQIGYQRRPGSYGGKPSLAVGNTLNRQFDVAASDRAWVTDITYIRTLEGFAYLAVVIDLYSRRVVGWSMQSRQTTGVVLQALHMAVWRRKPKQRVLIHSDQGSQFTSMDWAAFIRAHNLDHSMSRRGNCHDNAVAESIFYSLKSERIRHQIYRTREEARQDVFDYIEMFYNPVRKQVRNGMLSPAQFERQQILKAQGV